MAATTAVVGCTGLVGSNILSALEIIPSVLKVHCLVRREPKGINSQKFILHNSSDPSTWHTTLSSLNPPASIFWSSLAITRAAAGSIANQRKIDYDLNLSLAQSAKASGTKVYVLISAAGANASSYLAAVKMKGEIEEAIKQLEFEKTVIVRPGLLVGTRDKTRTIEAAAGWIAGKVGQISNSAKDIWAQDAHVVAKAAVHAGYKALVDPDTPKVLVLGQGDIVRLGRTEWEAFITSQESK